MEPVGPLPPSVYWRRRCLALASAALVLGLLVWGVASLAGGDDAAPSADPRAASFVGPDGQPTIAPAPSDPPGSPTPAPGPPAPAPGDRSASLPPSVLGSPARGPFDPRAVLLAPPGGANGPLPVGRGLPTAAPGAPPSTAPSAGPSATARAALPPPGPPGPCSDAVMRVIARTDKPRYAPGEKPVLGIVITNTGPVPCVRDLDAARQAVAVVRTPGDGLWGSNDCDPVHTDDVRTLAPGQSAEFSVRWTVRTSSPGCRGARDPVPPGAYELLARLDGIISDPVAFILS